MRFTYRLIVDRDAYVAECVDSDAMGEGKTPEAAVASLRTALEERMLRPDAIAPPSKPAETKIELVLADEPERPSRDRNGRPDNAPAR